jgi:hypothetical protein
MVSYCNTDCQKEHWKKGRHKYECKEAESFSSSIGVKLDPPLEVENNHFTIYPREQVEVTLLESTRNHYLFRLTKSLW